jgi:hypothetical protein
MKRGRRDKGNSDKEQQNGKNTTPKRLKKSSDTRGRTVSSP